MKVCELAEAHPEIEWINVCDSDSDMYHFYDYFANKNLGNFHYIVRACHNERKTKSTSDRTEKPISLHDQVLLQLSKAPLATYAVKVREREGADRKGARHTARKERKALLEIRAFSLEICRGRILNVALRNSLLTQIRVNVVHVKEIMTPELAKSSETPIEWTLITFLPIETVEECWRIIQCYHQRWQIEIYFRILKQGCQVENRRLGSYESIINCLSIYMIIFWRISFTSWLCRVMPEVSCEIIFAKKEWQAVEAYFAKRKIRAKKPPTMEEFILKIAILGGYKKRKSPPGIEAI